MEKNKKVEKKVQAIIYDIKNNKPYFLILHRILRWKGWELLKETLEDSEKNNLKKALLRGIREEIGLRKVKIEKPLNKKIEFYDKKRKFKIIIKNIYLVRVNMKDKITLHENTVTEHNKYRWVDKNSAIKMLTFDNAKNLIKNLEI